MTEQQKQIDNDEISLKELIQKIQEWIAYLKTQWKLILLAVLLGGSLGYIYAYRKPITYKAELSFALEEDRGGGGIGSIASQFGIDIGATAGGAFTGSNLIGLMKSRFLVEKTLLNPIEVEGKIISIAEYYIQINKMRVGWDKKPALKNIRFLPNSDRSKFTLQQNIILKDIYSSVSGLANLTIGQKDKKTSITTVEVISTDEKFSKLFCENLAKEISEYYIEIKTKKTRMNFEILQKQTDSIRAELNNAITGVAKASDNVFNLNAAMNVKRAPSSRRQVDVQANTTILTTLVANLEMSKIALRKETPLIQIIDRPIFPLEKEKVGKLKSLILGGFLAGFLSLLFLIFSNLYKKILA